MIKAWFKKRKVKFLVEEEIDSWDLEYKSPEQIKNSLSYKVQSKITDEILKYLEYDIEETAKNLLFEILEDPEFKTGLSQAVRDNIKDRFTRYLERL